MHKGVMIGLVAGLFGRVEGFDSGLGFELDGNGCVVENTYDPTCASAKRERLLLWWHRLASGGGSCGAGGGTWWGAVEKARGGVGGHRGGGRPRCGGGW